MENNVYLMNRTSGFMEKFKFVECSKSWKFNRKLCKLYVQKVHIL